MLTLYGGNTTGFTCGQWYLWVWSGPAVCQKSALWLPWCQWWHLQWWPDSRRTVPQCCRRPPTPRTERAQPDIKDTRIVAAVTHQINYCSGRQNNIRTWLVQEREVEKSQIQATDVDTHSENVIYRKIGLTVNMFNLDSWKRNPLFANDLKFAHDLHFLIKWFKYLFI